MDFKSTHGLPFLSAKWVNPANDEGWLIFKIGTVNGQWRATPDSYEILSVINDEPGNGHFQDVFDWFENSCKRDKKDLKILECWNAKLATHLKTKRGFQHVFGTNNVVKKLTP